MNALEHEIPLHYSRRMKQENIKGREYLKTWDTIGEFFGVSGRCAYNWMKRDPRLKKILHKYKGCVIMFIDDAHSYRETCLLGPYS